jgi:hypothetical protein
MNTPKLFNESEIEHLDWILDEALKDTFPASDPIAINFSRVEAHRYSVHHDQEDLIRPIETTQ